MLITKDYYFFLFKGEMKTTADWLFSRPAVDFGRGPRKYCEIGLLDVLCKVIEDCERPWKIMQHHSSSCKLMGNEIIVFPLGYSINLLMFISCVERRRLVVKMTALLMLSWKHEHTLSNASVPCLYCEIKGEFNYLVSSGQLTKFSNVHTFSIHCLHGKIMQGGNEIVIFFFSL